MSKENTSRLPAVPAALPGDEPALAEIARQLVERARGEGIALTGQGGLLPSLVANVLQAGLNIELDEHLGYEPYAVDGRGSGNSPQRRLSEDGDDRGRPGRGADAPRPRRRASTRSLVPKHARRLDGLSGQVISLYAKGMTTGEIQAHLEEIYGTDDLAGDDLEDHRRDRRGHGRLAEPAARPDLRGGVDRRDRDQGPRRPGRQPARLCGDRREPGRRTRRARACGSARPAARARSSG